MFLIKVSGKDSSSSISQQTFGSAKHLPAERLLEDYTTIIHHYEDCIQTHTKCSSKGPIKPDLTLRVLFIAHNSVALVHLGDTVVERYVTLRLAEDRSSW